MTSCMECGMPWGVILDRGEQPTDENTAAARAELVEVLLTEVWDADYTEDEVGAIDPDKLPLVRAELVVFIPESLPKFMDWNLGIDCPVEGDCWYPIKDVDVPTWLLNGRKTRWALLWPCCELGNPGLYARSREEEGT